MGFECDLGSSGIRLDRSDFGLSLVAIIEAPMLCCWSTISPPRYSPVVGVDRDIGVL